jgi:gluconokinase
MTILALDVGSSSVRALLFDHNDAGVRLIPDAIAQCEYSFDTTEAGQSTVKPEFLLDLVRQCIDKILQHPQVGKIEAVGMDTFVGNLTVSGNNHFYSNVYTYADTRSAVCVPELRQLVNTVQTHQRTGTIIHSAYYPAMLKWLSQTEPQFHHLLAQREIALKDFSAFCFNDFFGTNKISYSCASWSGLLNREKLEWDSELLQILGLSAEDFPSLHDYTLAQTGLKDDYAERWKQLANVPFYLAVGDGAAAQVGSGAVAAGTAALTIGTTAAIRKVSHEKLLSVPDGCWSYRIDKEHHLIGGALSEGGSIFAWARDTLKLDLDTLESELAKREPAEHDLTILPLLAGERSPGWRGDATGTIHGLRLSSTPLDIAHALLESVALRLAIVANQLSIGSDVKIMASGGALANSPAWAQIIADALQRPLHLIDSPEITAHGTAHLVLCAMNKQPVTGASPHVARVIEPRTQYARVMRELVEKQQTLYTKFYPATGS